MRRTSEEARKEKQERWKRANIRRRERKVKREREEREDEKVEAQREARKKKYWKERIPLANGKDSTIWDFDNLFGGRLERYTSVKERRVAKIGERKPLARMTWDEIYSAVWICEKLMLESWREVAGGYDYQTGKFGGNNDRLSKAHQKILWERGSDDFYPPWLGPIYLNLLCERNKEDRIRETTREEELQEQLDNGFLRCGWCGENKKLNHKNWQEKYWYCLSGIPPSAQEIIRAEWKIMCSHCRRVRKGFVPKDDPWYIIQQKWRRLASKALYDAIMDHKITRAKCHKCQGEGCNEQAEQWHHESYHPTQWLVVIALCTQCHGKADAQRRHKEKKVRIRRERNREKRRKEMQNAKMYETLEDKKR